MPEHSLIKIDDIIECADNHWAKHQYASHKVYTLADVTWIYLVDDVCQIAVPSRSDGGEEMIRLSAKLCEACKMAVLWQTIISLQNRVGTLERRIEQRADVKFGLLDD